MNPEFYQENLLLWQQVTFLLVFVTGGLSLLNYIVYRTRLSLKRDYKDRYDIISSQGVSTLKTSHTLLGVAQFFFINWLEYEIVELDPIWFFVRFFIGVCLCVLYIYIAHLVLKFYYPTKISKKLKKLRYTPRINPITGNKMKLLSEEEEDAYLDEGMQAEEGVFSVDYDVWIDSVTGETKIEKYQGHLEALECDKCGFQTLYLEKEEILSEPTASASGELLKKYRCSYCKRVKTKSVKLTNEINVKDDIENRVLIDVKNPFSVDPRISSVKIEIQDEVGKINKFDFQSVKQAEEFLGQFELSKLAEK